MKYCHAVPALSCITRVALALSLNKGHIQLKLLQDRVPLNNVSGGGGSILAHTLKSP